MIETNLWKELAPPLWGPLHEHLRAIDLPDEAVRLLAQFIAVSRNPALLLALFERDRQALPSLLQLLSTSPAVAALLINDPESLGFVLSSDEQPDSSKCSVDDLASELQSLASAPHAASAIRRFAGRELLRIAHCEFVQGLPPDRVARKISQLTDAVLGSALNFAIQQTAARLRIPQRIDGSQPTYTIIAVGSYGGEEISYHSPLELLLLCDQIDRKNESHVKFNAHVAAGLLSVLGSCRGRVLSIDLRFQHPGAILARGHEFHDAAVAAAMYEREDHMFQRLAFVKARVAAGDPNLGGWFLRRIEPWVYRRSRSHGEVADFRVLQRKLEKRGSSQQASQGTAIADIPGSRHDIELTIRFLQLLHGGELPEIRVRSTLDAIVALNRHGCLTEQEAASLAENLARLCRLEHHLAALLDHRAADLPDDKALRTRLAWRLGVRLPDAAGNDPATGIAPRGDLERFDKLLSQTLDVNRRIINHLMAHDVAVPRLNTELNAIGTEAELILDPDADPGTLRELMAGHGFTELDRAIDHLSALGHETIPILSPRRCRYYFASIAPHLLQEIATTPVPDDTLSRLVAVSDSVGAKATLWELLSTNHAMLRLLVQLCSLAPYLTEILIENPGMIDELVDSLAMDRLPRAERLDMRSIRLCQSADELRPILQTFQAGCHLMIGVRDLLGKESIFAIGEALSDTADVILRRVIQHEQERLAARFGDPVDEQGNEVEMVAVALGDFAASEPHYYSPLGLTFLYTAEGQTRRRVGGSRTTLSNRQFFNQLAQNVICQLDSKTGRLYQVEMSFSDAAGESPLSQSIASFVESFRQGTASLWQRTALCQSRSCSGSPAAIDLVRSAIGQAIVQAPWQESRFDELKDHRKHSELIASPNSLKRGAGGTDDVRCIVVAGILQSSNADATFTATGVVDALDRLAATGVYAGADAETLVDNYLYLRTVQAKLGLLNTTARDELPLLADGGVDTPTMKQLAALLGDSDPHAVVRRCEDARRKNRELFDRLLTP